MTIKNKKKIGRMYKSQKNVMKEIGGLNDFWAWGKKIPLF